jgi:2-aminoadipate transaminase
MAGLPNMQMLLRPEMIEFGWGHPAFDLLPAAELAEASRQVVARHGPETLVYGAAQGPGRLIELLRERLERIDGQAPPVERMLVSGGISQALDMICSHCTNPGDIALVESPVYHFGLRLLRDRGLDLWPVHADQHGIRPDALAETLRQVEGTGRRARLLYTVPIFNNPTGSTLALERRQTLMDLVARHKIVVIEDDAYRELWFDRPPPPSLSTLDFSRVIRLGSFSKILAPGLRLGWIVADDALIGRLKDSGLLTSGGGINHFTANVVAEFMSNGSLETHVPRLRAAYRERRDILLDAMAQYLPDTCSFMRPEGGFFVWVTLPEGLNSTTLLPQAEAAGVAYLPGERFFAGGGGQRHLRLAFSLLSSDELRTGASRLGLIIRQAISQNCL